MKYRSFLRHCTPSQIYTNILKDVSIKETVSRGTLIKLLIHMFIISIKDINNVRVLGFEHMTFEMKYESLTTNQLQFQYLMFQNKT